MQSCGACRLCCRIFPLPVLDKPAEVWCRHSGAAGCAIHGPRTPEICRQYNCYWREHDAWPDAWRPDRVGIVATEAGSVTVDNHMLPVVLLHEDLAECHTGGDAAREMLAYFVRRGVAVMVIRGPEARIEFDRERWPGISADDIEAALRYELSQDADELKRLGAVGDDYRPLSREEAETACRAEQRTP